MEISSSGQVGCLSGTVPCLHWTLSEKNQQPQQAATSDACAHLAQGTSFSTHRARGPGKDPVVRFRPSHERYRPFLGGQARYLANNRSKMPNHRYRYRYSNNRHIHARLYPRGIQRMAHKDGGLASWGTIQLQGVSSAPIEAGVTLDLRSNKPIGRHGSSNVT